MREIHEFKINEEHASRLFQSSEGKVLGPMRDIRKIEISPNDPRFEEIAKLQKQLKVDGDVFFYHWSMRRIYSKTEIQAAEMFHFIPAAFLELAGESCGTVYDASEACPHCGAGARQSSDLALDLRKASNSKDVASTIANELIISERLAEALTTMNITGIEILPVKHKARYQNDSINLASLPSGRKLLEKKAMYVGKTHPGGEFWDWQKSTERKKLLEQLDREHAQMMRKKDQRRRKSLPKWYQLRITSQPVSFAATTHFGINPFDDDNEGYYRCPLGHTLGLNMISEAFVKRGNWDGIDVVQTDKMIGVRSGLLRPRPIILISQRVREVLIQTKAKGFKVEVAYLI